MTETSRAECIQFKLVMYKSVALELEEILRFRGGAVVVGIGIYQICGSKITLLVGCSLNWDFAGF